MTGSGASSRGKRAVEFETVGDELHLLYVPRNGDSWIFDKFAEGQEISIKDTFFLSARHCLSQGGDEADDNFDEWAPVRFAVAKANGEYFHFNREVLGLECDVLIARDAEPTWKWFTSERRVSVMRVIAELKPTRIVIGGDDPEAIPVAEYITLLEKFPTSHELRRYVLARVAAVVREYSDATVDAERLFTNYVGKRIQKKAKDIRGQFRTDEARKFQFLHKRLTTMLALEDTYDEAAWQAEILQIVLLLNPKYIAAFERAPIRDFDRDTMRELDIMLVDVSGNVDIVEIKKPFGKCIVTEGTYRDNHIPLRELTGAVMQLEKYIFHLNRWGPQGEDALAKRFAASLPKGFRIRITNPSGIVIMGRDHNMSLAQRRDFDVVRRKYRSVADIVTYDDLLRRLNFVLAQLTAPH
jgi:hypothetical protein